MTELDSRDAVSEESLRKALKALEEALASHSVQEVPDSEWNDLLDKLKATSDATARSLFLRIALILGEYFHPPGPEPGTSERVENEASASATGGRDTMAKAPDESTAAESELSEDSGVDASDVEATEEGGVARKVKGETVPEALEPDESRAAVDTDAAQPATPATERASNDSGPVAESRPLADELPELTEQKSDDPAERGDAEPEEPAPQKPAEPEEPAPQEPAESKESPSPQPAEIRLAPRTIAKGIVLPNTTVGKPYSPAPLDASAPDAHSEARDRSADPISMEDLGLTFDSEKHCITGVPTKTGEYRFTINVQDFETKEGERMQMRWTCYLTINADPRTLWTEKATDPSAPYQKSHEASKATYNAPRLLVGASKRGRSHAREGKFRDDDFAVRYCADSDWYLLSVADGAGSAKFSRRGSEIAVEAALNALEEAVADDLAVDLAEPLNGYDRKERNVSDKQIKEKLYRPFVGAAFSAAKAVEALADGNEQPAKHFSTTLLIAACKQFDVGYLVAGFGIGDGGIGLYDVSKNRLSVLSVADSGEYAGQTRFLAGSEFSEERNPYDRLKVALVPDFTALVLMTDGITDPKFETDARFENADVWREFWRDDVTKHVSLSKDNEHLEKELLDWLDFWSPGNHDDRTIAILC